MNEGDRNGLDTLEAAINGGYGYIVNNCGKIVALITAIIATIVTFTDVTFASFTGESLTTSLVVMLAASYVMYFSLEDAGERLGEGSTEFGEALTRYLKASEAIMPNDILPLREFCHSYSLSELEYRRRSLLASYGYSEEEYRAYEEGTTVNKAAAKIFKRVARMKPSGLTPTVLLSRERVTKRSELEGPSAEKRASTLLGLLPTTIGTFLTVSVILSAKDSLTAETVMEGLLKLSALPIVGFKGYQAGYFFAKNKKSLWLNTKARILEEFKVRAAVSKNE